MNRTLLLSNLLLSGLCLGPATHAAERNAIELKEGDRVVLLGDDLIERNQKHGYLETLLMISNPGKNLSFRNLGWSGDTVFGDARAGFGTRADGFAHLKEHVLALKPTVILVGYGMSESFDGKGGLPQFAKGLNDLLDVLAGTKAAVVLIAPIRHENLGPPLPDPADHNGNLQLYRDAIARVAGTRDIPFVDLGTLAREPESSTAGQSQIGDRLTDDGIHLNEVGYCLADSKIASNLGSPPSEPSTVQIKAAGDASATGARVANVRVSPQQIRFEVVGSTLPLPACFGKAPKPDWLKNGARLLKFDGLEPGRYTLKIDGKVIATASAEDWKSMELTQGPEVDQVERLRRVINEKNRLYFYRWRPQNETYLFGFRKHEQGNNAREIPLFDPLVEAKEKEIATLRVPLSHRYELIRE